MPINTANKKIDSNDYTLEAFDAQNPTHMNDSVALMQEAWSDSDSATHDYATWQYKDNPYGSVIGRIAYKSGDTHDPAAPYVTVPSELWIPSLKTTKKCVMSVNTVTSIRHRKQGLFVKSAKATYDDAAALGQHAVYGFPNENSVHGFRKLGFRERRCSAYTLVFFHTLVAPQALFHPSPVEESTVLSNDRSRE